ncbi:MAG: hypothetical protein CMH55_08555 [Myxococcales bacterium]|nr:hypothetical protein [Myxococcales bacterium]
MTRLLDYALLLGLAVAVLLSAAGFMPQAPDLPDSAWLKAGRTLAKRASRQDTILLNNGGSTEGLALLRDQELKPLLALPEPRGRVQKLWVLGRRAKPPAGLDAFHPTGPAEAVAPGLTLWSLQRPGGSTLWRASEALEMAAITVGKTRCSGHHPAGRSCPGLPDWMRVTREQVTISGRSHHCLWAHPPAQGTPLVIDFGPVPEGELLLRHGLSDAASRSGNTSPVELRIFSAHGERLLRAHNQAGFQAERLAVKGRLKLKIRAQKDGMRHYCFSAEIR